MVQGRDGGKWRSLPSQPGFGRVANHPTRSCCESRDCRSDESDVAVLAQGIVQRWPWRISSKVQEGCGNLAWTGRCRLMGTLSRLRDTVIPELRRHMNCIGTWIAPVPPMRVGLGVHAGQG